MVAEAEKHFKIQVRSPRNELTAGTTTLKVKVSGGWSKPFSVFA